MLMWPVCCMRSFILHVKISPDLPPVAIVSVSGKQGGSVSMCSAVISATLTNSQRGCCLMKQSFTSYCCLMGVKSSNSGIHKKAWKTRWCLQYLSNAESHNFMMWPVHAGVITIYSLLLVNACQPVSQSSFTFTFNSACTFCCHKWISSKSLNSAFVGQQQWVWFTAGPVSFSSKTKNVLLQL